MSASTAKQLYDANGDIVKSQYYDPVSDSYKPGGNPGGGGGGSTTAVSFCDQVVIAVTGTPVGFASHAMVNGCVVKSLSSNSALRQTTSTSATVNTAVAGASGLTAGYILEPGEAAPYAAASNLTNTNQIYVNGQAGDVFSCIGS